MLRQSSLGRNAHWAFRVAAELRVAPPPRRVLPTAGCGSTLVGLRPTLLTGRPWRIAGARGLRMSYLWHHLHVEIWGWNYGSGPSWPVAFALLRAFFFLARFLTLVGLCPTLLMAGCFCSRAFLRRRALADFDAVGVCSLGFRWWEWGSGMLSLRFRRVERTLHGPVS